MKKERIRLQSNEILVVRTEGRNLIGKQQLNDISLFIPHSFITATQKRILQILMKQQHTVSYKLMLLIHLTYPFILYEQHHHHLYQSSETAYSEGDPYEHHTHHQQISNLHSSCIVASSLSQTHQ